MPVGRGCAWSPFSALTALLIGIKGRLVGQDRPVPMLRPRVKPEHAPYRIAGGKIRIGGVSYGLAGEILDPDGWVWTMLNRRRVSCRG